MFASLFQYLPTDGSIQIIAKRNAKRYVFCRQSFCTKSSTNVSALPLQEDSSSNVMFCASQFRCFSSEPVSVY